MLVAKMGQTAMTAAPISSPQPSPIWFRGRARPAVPDPAGKRSARHRRECRRVGASSLAAGHKTLVPELIGHLREMEPADIKVVVGGVTPRPGL
jgi:methylmalonyl-CoA mutase